MGLDILFLFNWGYMKMKKKILPVVLFSIILQSNVVNAESLAKENVHEDADTNSVEQKAALDEIKASQFFIEACTAYELARMETDAGKRSQFYADAVKSIAYIIATDAENGEAFLLASQIYRAKGGLPYAEKYLKRADNVFYNAVQANPQNIAANLDYAVFCYATSLTANSNQEKKAQIYAEKTIKLIEEEKQLQSEMKSKNNLRYEALAYLVKGDIRACEKLLSDAADYDKRSREHSDIGEENYSSSTYDRNHTTANIFYYLLFKDTVLQQKWIWPVAVKNVDREFLLYYLTDLSRNSYEKMSFIERQGE